MCNLYSETKGQAAIRAAARAMRDLTGNLAPMPGIFPDYPAPIICTGDDGVRELVMARWGMPSPAQVIFEATSARADKMRARGGSVDFAQLLKIEPDKGVTNVRNLASSHWAPHLAPASRCLVPFTCFSEFNRDAGGDIWFASKRGSALVLLRWDFADLGRFTLRVTPQVKLLATHSAAPLREARLSLNASFQIAACRGSKNARA